MVRSFSCVQLNIICSVLGSTGMCNHPPSPNKTCSQFFFLLIFIFIGSSVMNSSIITHARVFWNTVMCECMVLLKEKYRCECSACYGLCKKDWDFHPPFFCVHRTGKHELQGSVAANNYWRQIPAGTEDHYGSHRGQIPVANMGKLRLLSNVFRLLLTQIPVATDGLFGLRQRTYSGD